MRTMRNWNRSLSLFAAVSLASGVIAASMDTAAAFQYLSTRGGPPTLDMVEPIEVLKTHPQELKQLLIAAMSKGGKEEKYTPTLIQYVPRAEQLQVAREIVATYDVNDERIPYEGLLAFQGEAQDMGFIRQRIALAPDSDSAVELAGAITSIENPFSHAVLLELKDKVPGRWQESFNVQKFFAIKSGNWPPKTPIRPTPSVAPIPRKATAVTPPVKLSQPVLPPRSVGNVVKSPLPPPHSENVTVKTAWIIWTGGILVLLVSILFFVKRSS